MELLDGSPVAVRKYLSEHRAQLWAEALHLFCAGVEARLPDDLVPAQAAATDNARSRDTAMEDAVRQFIALRPQGSTMAEIVAALNLISTDRDGARLQMRDQHRLGAVLQSLGYAKRRESRNGARAMAWYPVE